MINPETGKIVSVNPTSTDKADRLPRAGIMSRLTVGDLALMLQELEIPPLLRERIVRPTVSTDQLTVEEVDALRDLAGERLQEAGFDRDYAPTELGTRLESLIDKLFVE